MNALKTACLTLALLALPALAADTQPADTKPAEAKPDCHHPPAPAASAAPAKGENWVLTRGEKLKGAPAVKLSDLLAAPAKHDGKTLLVEGTVRKACEKKGCWMELAPGTDTKAPGVRVTFKDYGFFVPLDSAGSAARVEGLVKVAELSEDRAKHYESEGAIVPRGKDGKPREIQLVATGVELRR